MHRKLQLRPPNSADVHERENTVLSFFQRATPAIPVDLTKSEMHGGPFKTAGQAVPGDKMEKSMEDGRTIRPAYKRVIMKISGEALCTQEHRPLDFTIIDRISDQLIAVERAGVEVGIIVGGGNIWRGARVGHHMDRATADYMGMLATVINALGLQDALESKGMQTRVQTAIEMRQIAEPYIRRKALKHLDKGRIVIFACGTGNPYFSTDTAAALRAAEMEVDLIMLAKNVDAVYDSDPKRNPNARKYDQISYLEVMNKGLSAMDNTALTLCMDNHIPIHVFGVNLPDSIIRVVEGEHIGTMIQ